MAKIKFKTITILGVGLIGGSIGLTVRKKKIAKKVVGLTTKKSTLSKALKRGAITSGSLSLKDAVKDADLLIVCAPVKAIPAIVKKIIPFAKDRCIITDVGSAKLEIVSKIDKIIPGNLCFVGGHPMAGSEKRGVAFASKNLFKGSICILTKTQKTDLKALKKVNNFWTSLGARVRILTPAEHDKTVAQVSHLPHIIAVALVNQLNEKNIDYASTGFKDTTRISAAAEDIWRDICLSNRKEILKSLSSYIKRLKIIKDKIKNSNSAGIVAEFKKAKELRKKLKK